MDSLVVDFFGIRLCSNKYINLKNLSNFIKSKTNKNKENKPPSSSLCYCHLVKSKEEATNSSTIVTKKQEVCEFCCRIPELNTNISNTLLKQDIIPSLQVKPSSQDELPTGTEVKAYMLPFVSLDPIENENNNDPNWDYLKNLNSNQERYEVVKDAWQSRSIPDPNVDLTLFIFYKKVSKLKIAGRNKTDLILLRKTKKRRLEEDTSFNPPKRSRLFKDITFYHNAVKMRMHTVYENYMKEISSSYKSQYSQNKLVSEYDEKVRQLEAGDSEVQMFHNFYSGLGDQIKITQEDVEEGQKEIDDLQNKFQKLYKWTGSLFYPR